MSIKLLAFGVAALMASTAQAAVTVYNSQAAYASALGTSVIEDFSDNTLVGGLSFTSTVGNIGSGRFNDRVVRLGAQTTFNFATPTNGFGAIFDETPGGFGQNLKFTIDGITVVSPELSNAGAGTFFGFISTNSFSSVLITAGSGPGGAETYNLDNLQFNAAVPEASTWAMMIAGFGLVGAAMRRRATAVAA